MINLSLCLSAARALLKMSVKSIAAAARLSDKTITQFETDADPLDPRVARLIELYEDLGVRFQRDGSQIIGVSLSSDLRRFTFCFAEHANPYQQILKLQHLLRRISGVVSSTSLRQKDSATPYDTIDIHFPTETRELVVKLLSNWIQQEGGFQLILSDGQRKSIDAANIASVILYGE